MPVVERRRLGARPPGRVLARQPLEEGTHAQPPDGSVLSENAAVVRACRSIAREFAQPLTGILAYSEMLLMDADAPCEVHRREVEGVRDGALRLGQLLHWLREAISAAAVVGEDHCAADEVERAMLMPSWLRQSHQEAG
jgi:hypothetical protein